MGELTIARLRVAVADPDTVARYWSHVEQGDGSGCAWWTGAISGRGHGRFYLGDVYTEGPGGVRRRRTVGVLAHVFGFALWRGVDELLTVDAVAHTCDNPLCQRREHWRCSNGSANRREYYARRNTVGGALADVRGSRGRARAVRDAVRAGRDPNEAARAGMLPMHRDQVGLFASPDHVHVDDGRDHHGESRGHADGRPSDGRGRDGRRRERDVHDQPPLFPPDDDGGEGRDGGSSG